MNLVKNLVKQQQPPSLQELQVSLRRFQADRERLITEKETLTARLSELESIPAGSGQPSYTRSAALADEREDILERFPAIDRELKRLGPYLEEAKRTLEQAQIPMDVERLETLAEQIRPEIEDWLTDLYKLGERLARIDKVQWEVTRLRIHLGDSQPSGLESHDRFPAGSVWESLERTLAMVEHSQPDLLTKLKIPSELARRVFRNHVVDGRL